MYDNNKNASSTKINTLFLKQFTTFEEAHFEFSKGINVFIGENATGKSHLIKILYTLIKTAHQTHFDNFENQFRLKLHNVFQINNEKKLVRSMLGMANVSVNYANNEVNFQMGEDDFLIQSEQAIHSKPSIYLPAQEFLSKNEGFIAAYNQRELPYDETYYDLSLALNALPLRRHKWVDVKNAIDLLQKAIVGESWEKDDIVKQENGRFYFDLPEGYLDVYLVGEGYRKMATLFYLLKNGSLTKDSILFWDEPEANLNPKLIVEVAKVLQALVKSGMQIFITTHDYLLSYELSLLAEYPSDNPIDIKFFSLHQPNRKAGVIVESGESLADIEQNSILEEFAAHYDHERDLFYNSTAQETASDTL
jgi:predicted ATP-dependent endonuclease of OLD family